MISPHSRKTRWSDIPSLAAREGLAIVHSGVLGWLPAAAWPAPSVSESKPMPVLLIHGYMGNTQQLLPIAHALNAAGISPCVPVAYASLVLPFDDIIDAIAAQAMPLARTYGQVNIVAHSLGALAAHAWIKALGGAPHVRCFISIAGPHHGTAWHRIVGSPAGRAMNPNGPWVKRLEGGEEPVPTTIIRTHHDHQVYPPSRARLAGAHEVIVDKAGHTSLLWCKATHAAIIDALRRA